MEDLSNCYLECFSDASFGNLAGCFSQGGFIIFLTDHDKRCPIFWQTKRIRRVVKSTLSAETMALLECAETAVYLRHMISEITKKLPMKIVCFVDNKSLVDAVYSTTLLEDKRLRIDMAVLRNMLENGELSKISWINSKQQLADCLTKRGASTENLRHAVSV